MASAPSQSNLTEFELTLKLEEARLGDNMQIWYYRYDCIVNKEYPDITLEQVSMLIRPGKFDCN
jgi:hypothetical protein